MLKLPLEDAAYEDLVVRRRAAGLPSVQAYILQQLNLLTEDVEVAEIVRQALKRAKEYPVGQEFRLSDLFSSVIWRKFEKSARLRAGRAFYSEISTATHGVRVSTKSSSGHQLYVRARPKAR